MKIVAFFIDLRPALNDSKAFHSVFAQLLPPL
jgi:hypothetical protein